MTTLVQSTDRKKASLAATVLVLLAAVTWAGPASAGRAECEAAKKVVADSLSSLHDLPLPEAQEGMFEVVEELMTACPDEQVEEQGFGARLANGTPALPGLFQEVVRMSSRNGVCTGVLLDRKTILTAAHCGCSSDYRAQVQTGSTIVASVRLELSGRPILFPGYTCTKSAGEQAALDLALFRVSGLVPASQERDRFLVGADEDLMIRFPLIRPASDILDKRSPGNLLLAGYGRTERGVLTDRLLIGRTRILSRYCLLGFVFRTFCKMHREMSLSDSALRPSSLPVDTCAGDSGGPVFYVPKRAENAPFDKVLVGITSRAIGGIRHPYPGSCGGGGIYTLVGTRPVSSWLRANGVDIRGPFGAIEAEGS